jgi:hypothetical protein
VLGLCGCSLIDLSALDVPSKGLGPGKEAGSGGSDVGPTDDADGDDATPSEPDAGDDGDPSQLEAAASDDASIADATDEPSPDGSSSPVADSGDPNAKDGSLESGVPDSGSGRDGGSVGGTTDAAADAPACMMYVLSPVAASASTTRSGNLPAYVFDQNFATRWESIQSADVDGASVDPQWVSLDFGASVFISQVQIDWQDACARDYQLQMSNDQVTWTTLANGTVTGNTVGSLAAPTSWIPSVDSPGLAGRGRYLRVYMTARCDAQYGDSIYEMREFGYLISSCN